MATEVYPAAWAVNAEPYRAYGLPGASSSPDQAQEAIKANGVPRLTKLATSSAPFVPQHIQQQYQNLPDQGQDQHINYDHAQQMYSPNLGYPLSPNLGGLSLGVPSPYPYMNGQLHPGSVSPVLSQGSSSGNISPGSQLQQQQQQQQHALFMQQQAFLQANMQLMNQQFQNFGGFSSPALSQGGFQSPNPNNDAMPSPMSPLLNGGMLSPNLGSANGFSNGMYSPTSMDSRTVYVGNLPANASVDELLSQVRFGPIEVCIWPMSIAERANERRSRSRSCPRRAAPSSRFSTRTRLRRSSLTSLSASCNCTVQS